MHGISNSIIYCGNSKTEYVKYLIILIIIINCNVLQIERVQIKNKVCFSLSK